MGNETATADPPLNLDAMVDTEFQVFVITASVLILSINGLCLVALNRTKHTPKVARFLSSALLVFDFVTVLLYTIRKMVSPGRLNMTIQAFGIGWSFLTHLNIAIMSIERLIVFQWPNFYLRRVTFSTFRKVAFTVWIVYMISWTVGSFRCTFCCLTETGIRICFLDVVMKYIMITFPLSSVVSCCCLTRIVVIIQLQASKLKEVGCSVRKHKSTIVVMLCCFNSVVTMIIHVVILLFTLQDNVKRRIILDSVMIVNGFVDTFVYVLWYKECRLEILKLLAKSCPVLENRVENFRKNVFHIPTTTNNP